MCSMDIIDSVQSGKVTCWEWRDEVGREGGINVSERRTNNLLHLPGVQIYARTESGHYYYYYTCREIYSVARTRN